MSEFQRLNAELAKRAGIEKPAPQMEFAARAMYLKLIGARREAARHSGSKDTGELVHASVGPSRHERRAFRATGTRPEGPMRVNKPYRKVKK